MVQGLGIALSRVDDALRRLLDLGLVAFRPWRHADSDGVWQLLPLPGDDRRQLHRCIEGDADGGLPRPAAGPTPLGDVLAQIGFPRSAP